MDLLTSAPFLKAGLKQSLNILIGINYSDLHHALEEVNGSPEELIARRTPLGWTCIKVIHSGDSRFYQSACDRTYNALENQIKKDK